MNRKGFMAELRNLLAFMDSDARALVMKRYDTMFDEAGAEGEEALIRCFGSPVRQVLQIEQEYREAIDKGETPFADSFVPPEPLKAAPAAEEPELPFAEDAEDFELPAEEEAAAILPAITEPEEAAVEDTPEPAVEEPPVEEEAPVPVIEEVSAPVVEEAPAPVEIPVPEAPAVEAPVSVPAPVKEQEIEEEEEEEEEDEPDRPGAGRVIAAILVTVPMIVLWAVCLSLSLALGAVMLSVGAACGTVAVYFMSYVFSGAIGIAADRMLMAGGALVAAAVALLFIWLGLWIFIGGCIITGKMTAGIYRGVLGKRKEE